MFIFYDLETSDLDKSYSQILQIGMIFADDDFNMMSSKDIRCKREPWIIPSPGALLTTGFTADDMKNAPNSHFELMQEVDRWIRSQNWPITFVGYNNIGFDEEFLQNCLHQTLHEPFLTVGRKTANDPANNRADVLTLVKTAHKYMPGVLKLEIDNGYGKPSMSLGNVARQNGVELSEDDAHEAIADVKATIAIAKLIRTAAPEIYDQWLKLAPKSGVDEFLSNEQVFTYQNYNNNYIATSITDNNKFKNEHVVFDLSQDPTEYLEMSVDELTEVLKNKDIKKSDKPFQVVKKNKQPILMPISMSDAVISENVDMSLMEERANLIKANKQFQNNIAQAAANALPVYDKAKDIEKQIYDFPPNKVKWALNKWMKSFRESDWDKRVELIKEFDVKFKDDIKDSPSIKRFNQFAKRLMYSEAQNKMTDKGVQAFAGALLSRLTNEDLDVPHMTLPKARAQLEKIEEERASGTPRWQEVTDTQIRSLKLFYTSIEKELNIAAKKSTPDIVQKTTTKKSGLNK